MKKTTVILLSAIILLGLAKYVHTLFADAGTIDYEGISYKDELFLDESGEALNGTLCVQHENLEDFAKIAFQALHFDARQLRFLPRNPKQLNAPEFQGLVFHIPFRMVSSMETARFTLIYAKPPANCSIKNYLKA